MNIYKSIFLFLFFYIVITLGYVYFGVIVKPNAEFIHNNIDFHKIHSLSNYDVIVAGDSRSVFGVNALMMSKISGRKIGNFSFWGIRFDEAYLKFLGYKIGKGGSIVFNVHPSNFNYDTESPMMELKNKFVPKCLSFINLYVPSYQSVRDMFGDEPRKLFLARGKTDMCCYAPKIEFQNDTCNSPSLLLNKKNFADFLTWCRVMLNSHHRIYFMFFPDYDYLNCASTRDQALWTFMKEKLQHVGAVFINVNNQYETYDGTHLTCNGQDKFTHNLLEKLTPYLSN